ncbi:hypothetical protein [Rhizobium sp. 21-4511-3d]
MRSIMSVAAAATFAVMASSGWPRAAPQLVRRGDLDLSQPYIPPARPKATAEEKAAIRDRMRLAQTKRERKAEKLRGLVASGAMLPA